MPKSTDNERLERWAGWLAAAAGVFFCLSGIWAMAAPRSFFEGAAPFEPYNQHFLQDIGAFQIGLGAVLLLAFVGRERAALAVALLGTGVGSAAHLVSHLIGIDLGGRPASDIPLFFFSTLLLLGAGAALWRRS